MIYLKAILAGIISGIGLVILAINIVVLIICRRQLKSFLKSGPSSAKSPSSIQSDMIQEYFDTFNTLHHSKSIRGNMAAPTHTTSSSSSSTTSSSTKQVLANSSACCDDLLICGGNHENTQLFYNNANNNTHKHHQTQLQSATAVAVNQQSSSAFKPFCRNTDLTCSQNQYDKMNHHVSSKILGTNLKKYYLEKF